MKMILVEALEVTCATSFTIIEIVAKKKGGNSFSQMAFKPCLLLRDKITIEVQKRMTVPHFSKIKVFWEKIVIAKCPIMFLSAHLLSEINGLSDVMMD